MDGYCALSNTESEIRVSLGGRKRPERIHFPGFTLYCTHNRKGKFKVGRRTEKLQLRRSLFRLRELMRRMRHLPVREQVIHLNRVLRGHYAYYGLARKLPSPAESASIRGALLAKDAW